MKLITVIAQAWRDVVDYLDRGLATLPGLGALVTDWETHALAEALEAQPSGRPLLVRLTPRDGGFERSITLPGVKASNVQQVLAFNLERWSPFAGPDTAALVAPDTIVSTNEGLTATVPLASRSRLNTHLEQLREQGWSGPIAFSAAGASTPAAYDFLTGRRPRTALVTPGDCVAGFAVSGVLAFVVAALAYLALVEEPTAFFAGPDLATQADAQTRRSPSLVKSMAALTEALPDTAYLETLRFDALGVTVTGLAEDAASLPALAEATGRFQQARIEGSIASDASGLEAFELVALHGSETRP